MNTALAPTSKKEAVDKLTFREYLKISIWSAALVFKLSPIRTIIAYISTISLSQINIFQAFIFGKFIDDLIKSQGVGVPDFIYRYLALYLLINVVSAAFTAIKNYVGNHIEIYSSDKLNRMFYLKLRDLGINRLEDSEIANKIHRADDNLYQLINLSNMTRRIVATILKLVSVALVVFSYSPVLLLVISVSMIPYFYLDGSYRRRAYKLTYDTTEDRRRFGGVASKLTSPGELFEILTSKAFGYLDDKYQKFRHKFNNLNYKIYSGWAINTEASTFLIDLALVYGYLQLALAYFAGLISVGDITFRMSNIDMFKANLDSLFSDLTSHFERMLRYRDIYEIFNMEPGLVDGNIIMSRLQSGPSVELLNVTFKYPKSDKHIFENLNLKIRAGEKIAIVGHNGAGKTTLTKILARVYDVNSGSIHINGDNIQDVNLDSWYSNIAVLSQDFNKYASLTVQENIAIGDTRTPPDDVAVRLAALSADALGFIEELPNKFDQLLREDLKGGTRLSTGQWQKLALARFFYRNAPFVIFDEPTAAIDAVSEYNIFNQIYEFFKGKTVLIISHRFSTVRNADRIIVMEKGQIIEEGTHDHLMSLDGYYAKSFKLQAEGYSK